MCGVILGVHNSFVQGCARGVHSVEAPKVEPSATSSKPNRSLTMTESVDGKEVYTSSSARGRLQESAKLSAAAIPNTQLVPIEKVVEEEDDLEANVSKGTSCQRAGCKVTFVSDEENRIGDGPGTKCVYHSGAVRESGPIHTLDTLNYGAWQPIFHEGSKVDACSRLRMYEITDVDSIFFLPRVTSVANVVCSNLKNSSRSKGVRKGVTFLPASLKETYVIRATS